MEPGLMLFAGIACIVVVIFAVTAWSNKKRTQAWQAVADELSVDYLGRDDEILTQYANLKIFSRGHSKQFNNTIRGDAGDTMITLGDYRYRTSSGKNSKTHVQTVCVLQSAMLDLPHCYLRREVFLFDALGQSLGGQDIDFDDDKAFSDAFVLQGDNETAVRNLFDAQVRQWFVAQAARSFFFETHGNTLLFHTGKRRPPREAKELMQQALEVMNVLRKEPREEG